MIKLAVLAGDGVGKEVMAAVLPVFSVLNLPFTLTSGEIGWHAFEREGDPIPKKTWDLIKKADAILLGATTSQALRETQAVHTIKKAYVSPIIQLRQQLDLYANIRPCFNILEQGEAFRFCIIRENTEGLYAGFDYYPLPDVIQSLIQTDKRFESIEADEASVSLRLQTKAGLLRIFHYAFEYAKSQGYSRVTLADKPNVLRYSSAFARELFESVALNYPDMGADILNVDAVALWLVKKPQKFGVIVAENMFADILSDLGAGVMGGLGLAPSANIGEHGCYFEPVHGSGLQMRPHSANPSAMFLTVAMMLEHFHYDVEAGALLQAVQRVIHEKQCVTYDLGGQASTSDMASAVLNYLR
jgi:isocitrate/isopropylmalate dehydrogenase